VGVTLSFTGGPLRTRFGVSDREQPFALLVGVWGGGGFLGLELDAEGLQFLEGALEFGARAKINLFGVAKGEGCIMAGFYFSIRRCRAKASGSVQNLTTLAGYVRVGGNLSIIGLISMSLAIHVEVVWQQPNRVYGWATLHVEIHMLFFSKGVDVRAEYEFSGSNATSHLDPCGNGSGSLLALNAAHGREQENPEYQPVYADTFDWDAFDRAFAI
jgi:hypothetical protein